MLRLGANRRRLDALRRLIDPDATLPSVSIDDAIARLERVVTERLQADEQPDSIAEQLMESLDVVPQGILLADAEGAVVFRNRAASSFFAARHSEALVGSAIDELIDVAVTGEAVTRTLDLFGPPRRALQLRAVPLVGSEPEAGGAFILVEDVSERLRLDAVRRDFVANISHELKTPVGALGVLAETLVDERDPAVVSRLAERMQREAFRVAHTIDDLLQLSQIEARELPTREPVPVNLIIAEVLDRTRPAAELGSVNLVADEVSPQVTVLGDRRQLISAVANLCDNAVKYSDPGDEVLIRASSDDEWVHLDIADEGIGIPAQDLERVFERFYRVDRARSRETGGTGLGLAIVRHVVQNHEGDVTVTSHEGEGSTFTLRLPAGPDAAAPPQQATA